MAEIAVSVTFVLAERLINFLNKEGGHQNVHHEVEKFARWLQLMKSYVRDVEGNETSEVAKNLVKQARDVAYDIEDILDEYILHVSHEFHTHKLTTYASKVLHYPWDLKALNDISKSVKKIETEIDLFLKGLPICSISNDSAAGSSSGSREADYVPRSIIPVEGEIVGYEKQKKQLLDFVTGRGMRLATISVVGPAGSGKSTLVKNIYDSERVQELFDCHAWLHVDRNFRLDDLMQRILKQLCMEREEDLKNTRFLVVLDDVWRQEDLEYIVNALPNGTNGSRIIFTSQNMGIASSNAHRSSNHILELNGLASIDSWNLFCKKAFGTGQCPDELVKLSQSIVTRCEGLPFAIAALGSLLSRKNPNQREWMKLENSLACGIGSNSIISRFLMPSFRDLSSPNKSCFLYFSIFPEDYSVNCGRLIRSWVAEGFVKKTGSRTAEEVAEDCLNELVERNLVSVSEWEIDGRVRSCRVLNLVRSFIISQAEDHNFVKFLDSTPCERVRRLSIQEASSNIAENKKWDHTRTAFLFKLNGITPSMIKQILQNFRLVRVLDLQDAPLNYFPDEIVALRLLRYLSLRQTKIREVPKSIKKLAFLETLDLKHTLVTMLPAEILKLRNLRHLLAYRYDVRNYVTIESVQGVKLPDGIGEVCSIQKLTLIDVNRCRGIVKSLRNLINLRKLGLIGLKTEEGMVLCASIQKMEKLATLDLSAITTQEYLDLYHMQNPPPCLQHLYLKGRLQMLPRWVSMLHCVVKIGLKWSGLNANENPLNTLQGLSNLMKLELVDCYIGEKLEFKMKTFKKLKVLQLEQFDQLNLIVMEAEAMPMLEKLTICKCKNLKMLPLGINYLSHLQQLLLYDMHDEFIDKLQKHNEHRWMVEHVKIIHSKISFTPERNLRWSFQNLS